MEAGYNTPLGDTPFKYDRETDFYAKKPPGFGIPPTLSPMERLLYVTRYTTHPPASRILRPANSMVDGRASDDRHVRRSTVPGMISSGLETSLSDVGRKFEVRPQERH